MNGFVLTDAAIEAALRPGQDVGAPANFTSDLAGAIAAQPRRWRLSLRRAWPRLTPAMIQLLLVLLLLLALALGAFAVGWAPSVDYTTRPGWILLEHFGANAPDGSGAASGPDGRSVWLIRANGTELHELAPGIPADGKTNPAWSRDGTHIAFESVSPKGLAYETDVDGHEPVLVGQHEPDCLVDGPAPCFERSPSYSPDGNDLATVFSVTEMFESRHQTMIYNRMRYGTDQHCGGRGSTNNCFHLGFVYDVTRVATSAASIEGLSWSPDGTQIAYYVVAKDSDGKPSGSSQLWLVDAVLPDEFPETHWIPLPSDLVAGDPDWSPDSSLIVFSSYPIHDWTEAATPGRPDIYTVRPDGSELQRLTHDGASGAPTWTSDGKILFSRQGAMWLMDADGSNAAAVYPDGPTLSGEATGWSNYGYWQPIP